MIWDCFPFFNELDLLECRLTELDPVVDRFVLAEADKTHQGDPKPYYFLENRERFAPWEDKIIHVTISLTADSNWGRENEQRKAISQGLKGMQDGDIFLLSDVDEIPFPSVIKDSPGHVLGMRNHVIAVNLIDPGWWAGTVARHGRNVPRNIQELRDNRHFASHSPPLRDKWGKNPITAGWHFTWLGGAEAMRTKARAFAHAEDRAQVEADAEHLYMERKCFSGTERHLLRCIIDETWPTYMQQRRGPAEWYWQ